MMRFTKRVFTLGIMCVLFIGYAKAESLIQKISTHEAERIIELNDADYKIIDIRTPEEFRNGHLSGAINIPHHALLFDISLLDPFKDKKLILYCYSGRRVKLVSPLLIPDLYSGLYHLQGDFSTWQQENRPVNQLHDDQ